MRIGCKGLISAQLLSILVVAANAGAATPESIAPGASLFGGIEVTKLIVMPDSSGHTDWVDGINSARSSLHMTMYHITDKSIVNALIAKAKDKNVDLKVIVDSKLTGGYQTVFNQLKAAGVDIRAASSAFSLTHSKDMVIDGNVAFISAINMTNTATNTRDFGIITPDQSIISEIEKVFAADWDNTVNKGKTTPSVSNSNLAWAPVNADTKLVQLINSATSTLVAETESFDSTDIINALNSAAARGVNVRLIVPECDLGNALFDYPYLAQLSGANVHVEHDGDSVQQPYMHSKMMLVDGETVYIGSINYSQNSINNDRELGAIFTNSSVSTQLANEFETDWNRSQTPAANPNCSSTGG